jgi:hypothetical protein
MEWTDDIEDGTHVNVLATMVTATGETRYELAPGFLNTAIQDDLNCKKKKENYKTILEETLVAHFKGVKAKAERALAKAASGGASTTTRKKNKLINALRLQNQELVSERQGLKETIKIRDTRIINISRVIELERKELGKAYQTIANLKRKTPASTKQLEVRKRQRVEETPERVNTFEERSAASRWITGD